jgi:YggT family protein
VEEIMKFIFSILSSVVSIYILLIFIRIIISWFSRDFYSRPVELLCRITDPYIDWWRRKLNLRLGFMDLSPIVGIAALSVLRSILNSISNYERIGIGIILGILLMAFWSVISFIIGFCIIVLVLRLFAFLTNRDIYTPFWKIVESISQPLLYKTNRLIFGNKIGSYLKGILITILLMTAIWIGGGYLIPRIANLLKTFPL